MSLQKRIEDDVKTALKAGNKGDLEVLRVLLSDVKNAAIAEGSERTGVADDLVVRVLRKAVKSREESAQLFVQGGRPELAERERRQIAVVERYLPRELAEAELATLVDAVIGEVGASSKKDMGKVVKEVLARAAGRADGKRVSGLVGQRLP